MENRLVDPGSIQGSHRPISFIRIKHRTRANDNLCKCLMYHAARFNHSHGRTHSWRFSPFYKMKYRLSTSNERVWCTTQIAKLSFNHSIGRTHSRRFSTFYRALKNSGAYKKRNNKKKTIQHIFLALSTPVAVSYHSFHVVPRWGALCNTATTSATYNWISVVVTMSAIKRYCRELSIEYFSLPKIGAVCEISSKERDGSSSLLLKAP